MAKTAHILCIAAGHGAGQYAPPVGFNAVKGDVADTVKGDLWIGHRPMLETLRPVESGDGVLKTFQKIMEGECSLSEAIEAIAPTTSRIAYPAMLQVIPHYLLRNRGRYLRYLRTTTGGDARLHGRISIGIGGHVDLADVIVGEDGSIDLMATVLAGGRRESMEEVKFAIAPDRFNWVGTLYATDEEVDTVHLGLVAVCDLTDEEADALDANHEIGDMAFLTFSEIKAEVAADDGKRLETWARLIIESNPLG